MGARCLCTVKIFGMTIVDFKYISTDPPCAASHYYSAKLQTTEATMEEKDASVVFREFLTSAKITPRMAQKLSMALILEEQANKSERNMIESEMNLIGKKCFYRPFCETEEKTATIVAVQEVVNLAGDELQRAEMDNGDVVGVKELYFFKSSMASASD